MKKAFTLLELLIVIIVVGALIALVVPNFTKTVEKTRAQQAITYLKVIAAAESIYKENNETYVECADAGQIRTKLPIDITEESYAFKVERGSTDDIATSFIATATQKNDTSKTITIDQDGNVVENWQ